MRHTLSDKDSESYTATCSVCGANAEVTRGKKIVCAVARREARARWREGHPAASRADRAKPSKHRLRNRKGGSDICSLCGPIQSAPWGIGFMCPTRAKELGWTPPLAPVPRCTRCNKYPLDSAAKCIACDDREGLDLGYSFKVMGLRRPGKDTDDLDDFETRLDDEFVEPTQVVQRGQTDLPGDGQHEYAVYGWKTIGSYRNIKESTQVRPEYAALYSG